MKVSIIIVEENSHSGGAVYEGGWKDDKTDSLGNMFMLMEM